MTRSTVQSCPAAPFPHIRTALRTGRSGSDLCGEQPVVEIFYRGLAQRARAAHEPVAVRAVDVEIEQAHEPRIVRVVEMMAVHERNANSLRRRLEHQRTRIEIVDPRRL